MPLDNESMRRIPREDLDIFVRNLLKTAGVDSHQVDTVTDNLLWNDSAGRRYHGVDRLPILLARVKAGQICCPAATEFHSLGASVERLEAANAFGQHAGRLAIDRAIDLARKTGVGVVGVSQSNFFGTCAYFLARATATGMLGLAQSNSYPKVAAAGGQRPVLGTNPFGFGAPRSGGRSLLVDMSTAEMAGSTLRAYQMTGKPLPDGLTLDSSDTSIDNSNRFRDGTLLPAAGAKGFGLALMVEVICGVLTGAGISEGVGSLYKDFDRAENNGRFFVVLDISRWMSRKVWDDRIETLARLVSGSSELNDVRLPGETRDDALAVSARLGIPVAPDVCERLANLAYDLGVACCEGLGVGQARQQQGDRN